MALRGTTKRSSVEQETRVASLYEGRRSRSSGAAVNDSGDVATVDELIECKTTGEPGKPARIPVFVNHLAKVVEEARERGRTGSVALRFYSPDHYLSNRDGWVEVTVRLTSDDAANLEGLRNYQELLKEKYGD
jgi:hypothetical protein